MRRYTVYSLLSAILLLLLPLLASAAGNLVQNGTFDTDVSSWDPTTSGKIAWEGAEGHLATGAAQVINNRNSDSAYSAGAQQCVALPTPIASSYAVQGWIKVPSQDNNTATGFIRLQFYQATDCVNSTGTGRDTNTVVAGSDWTQVTKETDTPSDAQSVLVKLMVYKTGTTSAYAYFDDVELSPAGGTTAVTLSGLTASTLTPRYLPPWILPAILGGAIMGFVYRQHKPRQ
ncbi:MAG: hypothetical protein J7M34_06625 [Anaerolineae bacterium]|nr:hypothetical protein [Anaerolineae bacterium]